MSFIRSYIIRKMCEQVIQGDQGDLRAFVVDQMENAELDVGCLGINNGNLKDVLGGIIGEMFSTRPATMPYVVAALVLAKKVDEYLSRHHTAADWYHREEMVEIMVGIWGATSFESAVTRGRGFGCIVL